jgi:DNA-3-methyladenine glycosylase
MFGPPGFLYCYFTYGMHWCANVVCGPEGVATAVLLRAGEVIRGADAAAARRPAARRPSDLARGPARLASALALRREANGLDLCDPASPVRLESLGKPGAAVRSGPRVGITLAADRPWRFWLDGEASVSVFRAGGRKRAAVPRQTGTP